VDSLALSASEARQPAADVYRLWPGQDTNRNQARTSRHDPNL